MRDKLFEFIEIDSFKRIENVTALTKTKKIELTEELEGKLRNHWYVTYFLRLFHFISFHFIISCYIILILSYFILLFIFKN